MSKKRPISFPERIRKIKSAGILQSKSLSPATDIEEMDSLETRIKKIIGLFDKFKNKSTTMIYFVMYDIEDNKVRREIAKYLERMGCVRVQKSIFLAETERAVYRQISLNLAEINQMYDNNDSILLVPVSTDQIGAMKIIGQEIEVDAILNNKNTLFF